MKEEENKRLSQRLVSCFILPLWAMSHPLHWGAVASKSKTLTREAKELSEGKEIFKEE